MAWERARDPGGGMVLVDDDPVSRERLAKDLRSQGVDIFATPCSRECLRRLLTRSAEAAVIEPNLPGTSWFRFMREIREQAPDVRVLVLTAYPSEAMIGYAERCGVVGLMRKPEPAMRILEALRAPSRTNYFQPVRPSMKSLALNEWEYVNQVISECGGNLSEAARILEVPRQTIYRKLRKLPPSDQGRVCRIT